jgi:hypothetical protein
LDTNLAPAASVPDDLKTPKYTGIIENYIGLQEMYQKKLAERAAIKAEEQQLILEAANTKEALANKERELHSLRNELLGNTRHLLSPSVDQNKVDQ